MHLQIHTGKRKMYEYHVLNKKQQTLYTCKTDKLLSKKEEKELSKIVDVKHIVVIEIVVKVQQSDNQVHCYFYPKVIKLINI